MTRFPLPPTLFFVPFFGGVAVGVVTKTASIFFWRAPRVSVRDALAAGSNLATHPERYVRADRVLVVRILNYMSVGLALVGVMMLVAATIFEAVG